MIQLNAEQVYDLLPMPEAIEAMAEAFQAISLKQTNSPPRSHLDVSEHSGTMLIMPAHVKREGQENLIVKLATVYENNPGQDLPTVLANVFVFNPLTGQLSGILDGAALTAIRTAAASAVATNILATAKAQRLALIGSGVQARTHLQAIREIRAIKTVFVYSRKPENISQFIADAKTDAAEDLTLVSCGSAEEAVENAEIVCALTNSSSPVFNAGAVQAGTHINAIGSHQPHAAEIPAATVAAARVFVDHYETAMNEAGDLLQPIEQGLIEPAHVAGEIGQLLLGKAVGRTNDQQITFFKSVGNAVQDAIAAGRIIAKVIRNENPTGN